MSWKLRDFTYKGRSIVREVFVETGTYQGVSLMNALRAGFRRLYSVEFCKANYEYCVKRFGPHPQVQILYGSSPKVLPGLLRSLPSPSATFWLDAHYQGHGPEEQDAAYGQCPLMAELAVIVGHFRPLPAKPLILIDDAHMFEHRASKRFDLKQWPETGRIAEALRPLDLRVEKHDNILYCVPPEWPK